jgi:SAM-dependent methyltransferase
MAQERGVSVSWVQQDMRNIDFRAEFDAAICLFTSFGYFESEEENCEVLRRVSRALRPKSRFVLDVENRDGLLMRYQSRDWWQTESSDLVMEERRFDPVKGRGHTKIILISEGRRIVHDLSIRWYSVPELERMLKDVGMQIRDLHGGLDGSQYGLDAMRLIVVAEKT